MTKVLTFKLTNIDLEKLSKIQVRKSVKPKEHQGYKLNRTEFLGFGNVELNLIELIENYHSFGNDNDYQESFGNDYVTKKVYNLVFNKHYLLEYDLSQKVQLIDDCVQDIKLFLYEEYFIKGTETLNTWALSRICYRIASKTIRSNLNYSTYRGKKSNIENYDLIFYEGYTDSINESDGNWIKSISPSAEEEYLTKKDREKSYYIINSLMKSLSNRQVAAVNFYLDGVPKKKGIKNITFQGNDRQTLKKLINKYL